LSGSAAQHRERGGALVPPRPSQPTLHACSQATLTTFVVRTDASASQTTQFCDPTLEKIPRDKVCHAFYSLRGYPDCGSEGLARVVTCLKRATRIPENARGSGHANRREPPTVCAGRRAVDDHRRCFADPPGQSKRRSFNQCPHTTPELSRRCSARRGILSEYQQKVLELS